MTTSAQALNEVLSFVSKRAPQEARFLASVAEYLKLDGDIAPAEAAKCLFAIFLDIERDIERVPLGDAEKRQLKAYIAPFSGLKSFAQIHLDIRNAKNNFLKPENLVGLMNVHMALSGHCDRPLLPPGSVELANDVKALAEKFRESELPERAKKIFIKRLLQISTSIDHFNLIGPEALEEELESLLGALAVYRELGNEDESSSLYEQAFSLISRGIESIRKVDEGLTATMGLLERGQKLWTMLPGG